MTPKSPRKRLTACATLAILLLLLPLTGCVTSSPPAPASLSQNLLTAPPILHLPKGQPVQTLEGQYVPARDEVWHSDARFRLVEQQLLDATTALNVLRSQKQ